MTNHTVITLNCDLNRLWERFLATIIRGQLFFTQHRPCYGWKLYIWYIWLPFSSMPASRNCYSCCSSSRHLLHLILFSMCFIVSLFNRTKKLWHFINFFNLMAFWKWGFFIKISMKESKKCHFSVFSAPSAPWWGGAGDIHCQKQPIFTYKMTPKSAYDCRQKFNLCGPSCVAAWIRRRQ